MRQESNVICSAKNRRLSIIVFSLFFSWLLSFLFEGQILYALADYYDISAKSYVFATMASHFFGLVLSGIFIRNLRTAKKLMLYSISFSILSSGVFFFSPTYLWVAALLLSAFLVGCSVAAWGFYFKVCTPKDKRIKTIADGLIFSNLLMILLNIIAIHISPQVGLSCAMLLLGAAFLFSLRLPVGEVLEHPNPITSRELPASLRSPLAFLCLFIVVITINSGLMYQVQGPAFSHLKWLTSWYWAVPYIAALLIMRNLPGKINRTYLLSAAIAMIGFSFIAFMILDRTWISYLVINTLMLGACGVYDLFWWSILGDMLDLSTNPVKIMGIGLSSNVLGVLLGGVLGRAVTTSDGYNQNPTLLALGVVCITLVLLPPLHNRLSALLTNHIFLNTISAMPVKEQTKLLRDFSVTEKLTERENEITAQLLTGKTYRKIAEELYVSENTVKTHVKNIYSKSGVKSRTELMNHLLNIDSLAADSSKSKNR